MISINVSELIWTVINFLLLVLLLNRFLYKPVISFMENRQARIDAGLQQEQDAKARIQENDQRLLNEKSECREQAKQLLKQNEEELAKHSAEALKEARETAVQDRKAAEEALAGKQEQTAQRLRDAAPELAAVLSAHLLGEE